MKCTESHRCHKFTLDEIRRLSEDEERGFDSSSSLDRLFLSVFLLALDLDLGLDLGVRLLSSVESIRFTWLGDASNL